MKNLIVIAILSFGVLSSCGNNPKENSDKPEATQQNGSEINRLSETELFLHIEQLHSKQLNIDSLDMTESKKRSVQILEASQIFIEKYPDSKYLKDVSIWGSSAAYGINKPLETIRILEFYVNKNNRDSTVIEQMQSIGNFYYFIDDKVNAEKSFQEIIDKFPNHHWATYNKELIKTVRMTEEEFNELIERKNAK